MKDNINDIPQKGEHREEQEYRAYRRSRIHGNGVTVALTPYMQKPIPPLEEVLSKVSPVYAELMNVQ